MAMFLSMPSALRVKHSSSSSRLYALSVTSFVFAPGTFASALRAFVMYDAMFLL